MIRITYRIDGVDICKLKKEDGRCYVCGRKLTDKKSKAIGIGKDCFQKEVTIVLEFVKDKA